MQLGSVLHICLVGGGRCRCAVPECRFNVICTGGKLVFIGFLRLYSVCPKKPGVRIVSVLRSYVSSAETRIPLTSSAPFSYVAPILLPLLTMRN